MPNNGTGILNKCLCLTLHRHRLPFQGYIVASEGSTVRSPVIKCKIGNTNLMRTRDHTILPTQSLFRRIPYFANGWIPGQGL